MLIKTPKKRIKLSAILNHAWFNKLNKTKEITIDNKKILEGLKEYQNYSKFKREATSYLISFGDKERID